MNPLTLIPKQWSLKDTLPRFPQRKAHLNAYPSVWVEELMQQRFGALMVCGTCAVKYRDGLRRWAYVRHPDMRVQGNACDFCKRVPPGGMPLWFKEEHRYPTQNDYARQAAGAVAPWPWSFQDKRRIAQCSP